MPRVAPGVGAAPGDGFRQVSSLVLLQASESAGSRLKPWCSHSVPAPCPVKVPDARLVACDRRAGGVEGHFALRIGRRGPPLEPSWSLPVPLRSFPPPRHQIAGTVLPCRPPTGC